uniref:Protein kinase domain-containing protein n=1 Tax=Salarias fasciatus TaxID=181472 RepID=A0A672H168_SALFA
MSNFVKKDESLAIPSSYEVLEILGEGVYGKVLKCRKPETDQLVAVKVSTQPTCSSLIREHFFFLCARVFKLS